ncbi:MAG: DNA translocase FtsK 4TM domain-containing protein, partial [Rubrobacteridae bacterium]|nr:DNA translocase FtsK 4TM domain-containing protein [Rubrobacteridae bacterium]
MGKHGKPSKKQNEHMQEVYGIAAMTAGIIVLVSLFSDHPGFAGDILQKTLKWLFGMMRHALPVLMLMAGMGLITHKANLDSEVAAAGGTITFLSALSLLHLSVPISQQFAKTSLFEHGGIFGASISYVFRLLFSDAGSYVIFGAGIIAGIVMATGLSIGNMLNSAAEKGQDVKQKVNEQMKTKTPKAPKTKKVKQVSGHQAPPMVIEEPTIEPPRRVVPETVVIDTSALSKPTTQLKIDIDKQLEGATSYLLPTTDLLKRTSGGGLKANKGIKENSLALEKVLSDFDVDAHVTKALKGPTVTRYELQLASG